MLALRQLTFFLHLGLGVALVHAYAGGLATLLRPATGHVSRIVRTTSTIGMAVVDAAATQSGQDGWFARLVRRGCGPGPCAPW